MDENENFESALSIFEILSFITTRALQQKVPFLDQQPSETKKSALCSKATAFAYVFCTFFMSFKNEFTFWLQKLRGEFIFDEEETRKS